VRPLTSVSRSMRRTTVDLNADVGEGCGQDAALFPLISSANIACGFHAGDLRSMREAVTRARDHGVAVGAHPSFADREHFGRREMRLSADQMHECIVAQITSLAEIAASERVRVVHVKPHGALYNMAARDGELAEAIVRAVVSVDPQLALFGLAGSQLISAGVRLGVRTLSEAFADRGYQADGTLLPRGQPGSVLDDDFEVARRAVAMVADAAIVTAEGTTIALQADTICIHGDTPGAARMAGRIRQALAASGISVAAPYLQP
jgi:UPF0271 protein